MPFTFAHPAAVLPFGRLSKRWASLTSLIIGSIIPDFEYFLRLRVSSIYSHTIAGLFWFDILTGLLLVIAYQHLIKDKLIDNLPTSLHQRLIIFKGGTKYTLPYLIVLIVSIFIGAVTHLLWDGFTHPTGYFVNQIPVLTSCIHVFGFNLYLYKILQHSSTLAGLTLIAIVILRFPKYPATERHTVKHYWLSIFLIAVTVLAIRLLAGLNFHQYGDCIVTLISGLMLGLVVVSIFTPNKTLPQT